MRRRAFILFLLLVNWRALQLQAAPLKEDSEKIARGRYMVKMAGCNDCHTSGYAQAEGKMPESEWLAGDPVGWYGPWGTSYPINLRTFVGSLTEDQWVAVQRTAQARPPMPTYVLREMEEEDLRAIYAFIRSLGPHPRKDIAPLPPGQKPNSPYFELIVPAAPQKQ